jgi:alanyl-tRNA synthetase
MTRPSICGARSPAFRTSRIIRIPTNDNFWAMGDTGPCGPCSEIFYDHGDHIWGGPPGSPDEDGDRFIEIWNLVFMQFEQITTDERVDLPRPSIDTGMGLERIAALLQGSTTITTSTCSAG